MGYEVAEQMDWELPDAIFYPTGGGVGMIGMWKAFDEMEKLGWIGSRRPKMIAVQAEGCQPVVRAFEENEPRSRFCEDAHTVASRTARAQAAGRFPDSERGARERRHGDRRERRRHAGGRHAAGLATKASSRRRKARPAWRAGASCCARGFLKSTDRIVIYNTGSGLKYLEAYSTRFPRTAAGEQDKLGGLITPAMKDLALRALDAVARRGVTYADVRAVETREREVTTKNGKAGHVSSSESLGIGIRVLAHGCWGFAATDDLTRDGIEAAAALALEIARAGTAARKHDVALAPEEKYEANWISPCAIDPFTIPVDRNLAVLLAVDTELRRNPGVSLAEASMHFERRRQVFASTLGSLIDQTRYTIGAGFSALSYKDGEIQKRSYPEFLRRPVPVEGLRTGGRAAPARERAAHRRGGRGAALRRPVPRGRIRPDSGQLAARACRFTNRSATPSNSIACWAARPITPA